MGEIDTTPQRLNDLEARMLRLETPAKVVTLIAADDPVHRVIWAARRWHRDWKSQPHLRRDADLFDAVEALNAISPDPSPEYIVSQDLRNDRSGSPEVTPEMVTALNDAMRRHSDLYLPSRLRLGLEAALAVMKL